MKASELRIGNYVSNAGIELEVCQIFNDSFQGMFVGGKGAYTTEYSEGIPLTEEWILKFGFQKIQDGFFEYFVLEYWNYIKTVKSKFKISLEKMDDYYMGIWIGADQIVHLYSVHSLQNLFFALSNQELTIKQ